jgi:hypothetical protein
MSPPELRHSRSGERPEGRAEQKSPNLQKELTIILDISNKLEYYKEKGSSKGGQNK